MFANSLLIKFDIENIDDKTHVGINPNMLGSQGYQTLYFDDGGRDTQIEIIIHAKSLDPQELYNAVGFAQRTHKKIIIAYHSRHDSVVKGILRFRKVEQLDNDDNEVLNKIIKDVKNTANADFPEKAITIIAVHELLDLGDLPRHKGVKYMDPLLQAEIRRLWFSENGSRTILYYAYLLTEKYKNSEKDVSKLIPLFVTPDQLTVTIEEAIHYFQEDVSILDRYCKLNVENGSYDFVADLIEAIMLSKIPELNGLEIYAPDENYQKPNSQRNREKRQSLWLDKPYEYLEEIFNIPQRISIRKYIPNDNSKQNLDLAPNEQVVVITNLARRESIVFAFINTHRLVQQDIDQIKDLAIKCSNLTRQTMSRTIIAAPTFDRDVISYLETIDLLGIGPINLEPLLKFAYQKSEEYRAFYFDYLLKHIMNVRAKSEVILGYRNFEQIFLPVLKEQFPNEQ